MAKPAIINDEDESGNSALHLAALNGHPKIIDILIDYGASVDPRNSVLWTPLDCAAAKGNVESVLKLLERDSPIDPIDLAYTTPLHLASREGHEAVVKALLEQGADPLLLDHTGKNALDMAIENSHKYVNFLFFNTFHANLPFLYLLKMSENPWFSYNFRGYGKKILV